MEHGQKNVRVRLLEGESENPVYCASLGQCVVHLDPALPKGTEVRVRCSYDANGTITVTAQVPATKASAFVELCREGFAELEPLAVWRKRLTIGDDDANPLRDEALLAESTLGPDSDIHELIARLDQIYAFVGRQVSDSAVPAGAVQNQRLMQQSRLERNAETPAGTAQQTSARTEATQRTHADARPRRSRADGVGSGQQTLFAQLCRSRTGLSRGKQQ